MRHVTRYILYVIKILSIFVSISNSWKHYKFMIFLSIIYVGLVYCNIFMWKLIWGNTSSFIGVLEQILCKTINTPWLPGTLTLTVSTLLYILSYTVRTVWMKVVFKEWGGGAYLWQWFTVLTHLYFDASLICNSLKCIMFRNVIFTNYAVT